MRECAVRRVLRDLLRSEGQFVEVAARLAARSGPYNSVTMGAEITFEAEGKTHCFALEACDEWILSAARGFNFCALFNMSRESPQQAQVEETLSRARETLKLMEDDWAVLPYRYTFECAIGGDPRLKTTGGGGASGFKINGRFCWIRGGVGLCYVSEMSYTSEVAPAEREHVGEPVSIDARKLKTVETEDWGPIKVRRRRIPSNLPEQFRRLIAFLEALPPGLVRVSTVDGRRTVMQLVRMAAEGDESAEEELFERGTAARDELIAKAANPKTRKKDLATIAWLLMTVLPSPESRACVEHMLQAASDPQHAAVIAASLAAGP